MEEVIRFDFLAMTGRFILISFYSLFHAFMVCSFLFESVYLLSKEKRKPPKKGEHVCYDGHARFSYQISILFCKLAHSYRNPMHRIPILLSRGSLGSGVVSHPPKAALLALEFVDTKTKSEIAHR